jgi:hypothetical protein
MLAAQAGRWAAVEQLARELEARRVAREDKGGTLGALALPSEVRSA